MFFFYYYCFCQITHFISQTKRFLNGNCKGIDFSLTKELIYMCTHIYIYMFVNVYKLMDYQSSNEKNNTHYSFIAFICVCLGPACHGINVEVRGQFSRDNSLLPPRESWKLNSGFRIGGKGLYPLRPGASPRPHCTPQCGVYR